MATYWYREKGAGMGEYIGRIIGSLCKAEEIPDVGVTFGAKDGC